MALMNSPSTVMELGGDHDFILHQAGRSGGANSLDLGQPSDPLVHVERLLSVQPSLVAPISPCWVGTELVVLMRNRAKCRNCGDIIESEFTHDWVCCGCFSNTENGRGIFVDGGDFYWRWGGCLTDLIRLDDEGKEVGVTHHVND